MTDHPTDGQLRAYLDHDLAGPDLERTRNHLAGCAPCREQVEVLQQRAAQVSVRLSALSPQPGETPHLQAARAQLEKRISEKENTSSYQPLPAATVGLGGAGQIVLLAVALAFPSVQAIANASACSVSSR
jgi:anti-sigma factor RsiW